MKDDVLGTIVVIAVAVFLGQWLYRALPHSPSQAAEQVKESIGSGDPVKDFLDAYGT